jgi:hypothetical protein
MHVRNFTSMGTLVFIGLCCAVIASVVYRVTSVLRGGTVRRKQGQKPESPSMPSTPAHFDEVQHEYRALALNEKIAVALIHRNHGIEFPRLVERLGDFYFSGKPQDALNRLMNNTKLVETSVSDMKVSIRPLLEHAVGEVLHREPPL